MSTLPGVNSSSLPERGDLLEIVWSDITESATGDPDEAVLLKRKSFGLFWGRVDDRGIQCVVTTTTLDEENESGQQGWCIYPEACIRSMKIVKRKRRKKPRQDKTSQDKTGQEP